MEQYVQLRICAMKLRLYFACVSVHFKLHVYMQ